MDRNFARSLALVLKSEGGWSDNPKDPGGATMKGVTLANFRRYVKADATKDDLRHITDAQVATVYRRFYWDAVAGAELPDGVDYAVFDFAVNSGPSRAIKFLQGILGTLQDGRIGPATVKAANAKKPDVMINALCDARLEFLKGLKTWGEFGKGWSSRVSSVRAQALAMAAQPAPIVIPQRFPDKPVLVTVTKHDDAPPTVTVKPAPPEPVLVPAPTKSSRNSFIVLIIMGVSALLAYFGIGH